MFQIDSVFGLVIILGIIVSLIFAFAMRALVRKGKLNRTDAQVYIALLVVGGIVLVLGGLSAGMSGTEFGGQLMFNMGITMIGAVFIVLLLRLGGAKGE